MPRGDAARTVTLPAQGPRLLVLSSLFPSDAQPVAGNFIRERMFRVARQLPLAVFAPQPWSPLDRPIRRWIKPHYRPHSSQIEQIDDGVAVYRPNFWSVPGVLKQFDGYAMARACWPLAQRLHRRDPWNLVDGHFGFPDGFAAVELARRLAVPALITLRGRKDFSLVGTPLEPKLRAALRGAARVIAVSDELAQLAVKLGVPSERICVIGNGVDLQRFAPLPQGDARQRLGLPADAKILISVGALTANKGFQRVIDCMPELLRQFPKLHFLIVGGPASSGDISADLRRQAAALELADRVHLVGRQMPDQLKLYYSAADLFVLATEYEGWANVLLEAMACGLPVVATRVGGNPQVVASPALGTLVDYWVPRQFVAAVAAGLERRWEQPVLIDYARGNSWERRVAQLVDVFQAVSAEAGTSMTKRVPAARS